MRSLLFLLASVSSIAVAQLSIELRPDLGKPAPPDFESVVMPDGTGLPEGSGNAKDGQALYVQQCAACHGVDGRLPSNLLVGGTNTLTTQAPVRTVGSYWPYATTLFDYINRAMPYNNPKSLKADEVYAISAYLLYLNDIITETQLLDKATLPKVRMPNRDGFFPAQGYRSE